MDDSLATTPSEPFFKQDTKHPSTTGNRDAIATRRHQLSRQAALISIQTFWRVILTRRKFLRVMRFRLTNDSTMDTDDKALSINSEVELSFSDTLAIQEKLIKRYHRYCRMYERAEGEFKKRLPPSFQFFCATYIQAFFRKIWISRAYIEYKNSAERDFDALEEKIDRLAGTQDDALFVFYDQAAIKIQTCWRSFFVSSFSSLFYRIWKSTAFIVIW